LAIGRPSVKLETMAAKSNPVSDVSFESSLKELEVILGDLENPKIPLADMLEKYGRAKDCLKACRAKLDEAELKVRKLSGGVEEEFSPENE